MPEFLSEMWLRDLDAAVQASATVAVLAPVEIEQVVSGVPGRGDVRYRIRIDSGGARVTTAEASEPPDLRLSTDYDTAVAIASGRENAQIALARGRLRLGGDIEVLIRRADALGALEDATAALRAATTYPSP